MYANKYGPKLEQNDTQIITNVLSNLYFLTYTLVSMYVRINMSVFV